MFANPAIRDGCRRSANGTELSPTYGRFLQADPLGYADDPNLYAYTHDDPVNGTDPLGLSGCDGSGQGVPASGCGDIVITPHENAPIEDFIFGFIGFDSPGVRLGGDLTRYPGGGIGAVVKKAAKTVYCAVAPHLPATLQVSATGSLAAGFGNLGGAAYSNGYTLAIDPKGSIGLFETTGYYKAFGAGAAFSVTAGGSNAKTVGDLQGPFGTGSLTATEAGGGTVDVFTGHSPDGQVTGGDVGLTFGGEDSGMLGINSSKLVAGVSCP